MLVTASLPAIYRLCRASAFTSRPASQETLAVYSSLLSLATSGCLALAQRAVCAPSEACFASQAVPMITQSTLEYDDIRGTKEWSIE